MMVLNLSGLVKAPEYHYEVCMKRKPTLNACQNARKKIAYVRAPNSEDAKREAKKQHPEFLPQSARRI